MEKGRKGREREGKKREKKKEWERKAKWRTRKGKGRPTVIAGSRGVWFDLVTISWCRCAKLRYREIRRRLIYNIIAKAAAAVIFNSAFWPLLIARTCLSSARNLRIVFRRFFFVSPSCAIQSQAAKIWTICSRLPEQLRVFDDVLIELWLVYDLGRCYILNIFLKYFAYVFFLFIWR